MGRRAILGPLLSSGLLVTVLIGYGGTAQNTEVIPSATGSVGPGSARTGSAVATSFAAVPVTSTPTGTATPIASKTASPTPVPTASSTPSDSPTASPALTATATRAASPSQAGVPTPTTTPAATSTLAPTATRPPAPTPTPRAEGPLTPIGDRDCGQPNDSHYTSAYQEWNGFGAGAFCIYHPQSEIVVAALRDVAAAASVALDQVQATIGMTAGRTINIYAHESWQQLATMSWLPMYAAFGDTIGIWMPYTRVVHADRRALLHELTHTVTFRAFPGANNLLAEGVAEWAAHEISDWAFFDATKADSCKQSLTELATMRPIPFECQGAAARIVEQLVNRHGGLGPYWDLVQAAYADPIAAPVTVYGLTWDEVDEAYR